MLPYLILITCTERLTECECTHAYSVTVSLFDITMKDQLVATCIVSL